MLRKPEKNSEDFWREYEEKTGEKVLTRSLGQYLSGWEEFDGLRGIWGLIMFTSGGFRFHHFPQQGWLLSIIQNSAKAPSEKTIFIPTERITGVRLMAESKWWKKLFVSFWPHLVVTYRDESGNERLLLLEADTKSKDIIPGNFAGKLEPPST